VEHIQKIFGDRYQPVHVLKERDGITTVLATDQHGPHSTVLIKVATTSLSAQAQFLLDYKITRLRPVRAPSLATVLELGRTGECLYLIRAYVPGTSLEERLLKGPPLQLEDALTVGCCVLEALEQAHEQNVLHLHLKPSEVILAGEQKVQSAVLTDFELDRRATRAPPSRNTSVDLVPYLSPEHAGVINHAVDRRTDLYAAGALLFSALAGRPPFEATTLKELSEQLLTIQSPKLRALGLAVPRALDEILHRLLRKDPRDRYQSAAAALADLRQLARSLEYGRADSIVVVGHSDRRQTLTEPAFIGRNAELAALHAERQQAARGQCRVVLLEAPSGGGKTTLLDEFEQGSLACGALVLRGQGLTHAIQRPFQILEGIARGIVAATHIVSGMKTDLQQRLDNRAHRIAIGTVLPLLTSILPPDRYETLGPEAYGETRALQGLCALLSAVGTADKPAVILLDDCQWADELTIKLVAHLQRHHATQPHVASHVLLVVSFRSDEVPDGHLLRHLPSSTHITLAPFSTEDLRALVTSMAGPIPDEAIQIVTQLAEGSPFMATAILRGLVESAVLEAKPAAAALPAEQDVSTWKIAPQAWMKVQSSYQAAVILARRLGFLPPPTLRMLTLGAVLGKEFDVGLAARLAGHTVDEAMSLLVEARQRHLVWIDVPRGLGRFVHDKLHQALLDRLGVAERQDLHKRAALAIEAADSERVYELAHHFTAAGEYERAVPYALSAAGQARLQYALETAEHYYRLAECGVHSADASTRLSLAMGLSDVLMLRGRYEEAAKRLEDARSLTDNVLVRGKLEGQLGELAFKRGDVRGASAAIERGLMLLGRTMPRRTFSFAVLMLWETFVQTLHTLLPGLFVARFKPDGDEAERLAIRLYSRLTYAYFFHRGSMPSLWSHLREMNLAERRPPSEELAQAYSEHSVLVSLLPYYRRGLAYAEKGLAVRLAHRNVWGQGQSLHFYGIVLYTQGRLPEALDKLREAVKLLERTGDRWEMNMAQYHIACCLYRLGDLRGAIETGQRLHEIGMEIGDGHAAGISLEPWAKAADGKLPPDLIDAALQRSQGDVHSRTKLLQAKAVVLLDQRRPADAASALKEALDLVKRTGLRGEYVAPVPTWLATALRQQAVGALTYDPQESRRLLRRARAAARAGLRLARSFPNNLAHALRENGLLAAMQGRHQQALHLLEESLTVAERQGARFEYAQSLLAKGRLASALGWGGADDVATAEQALRLLYAGLAAENRGEYADAPGHKRTAWSMADRFHGLLSVGHRITSAFSRETIFAEILNGVRTLLRGEASVVVEVTQENGLLRCRTVAGDMNSDISNALAMRVLGTSRPVVFPTDEHQDGMEALVMAGVRSALYAPIFERGRIIGCFGTLHAEVDESFGDEEVRLAEFIMALAGAALEHSDAFAELHQAHKQLQVRAQDAALVTEITAAVTESGSLRAILQECAEIVVRHFNAAFVRIWTHDEGHAMLDLQASAGIYTRIDGAFSRVPVGTLKIGMIAQNREPYLSNHLQTDPFIRDKDWAAREGLESFAAYPLTIEHRVVGVLAMFARTHLPDATLHKLSLIAEGMAQCVIRKWADDEVRLLNQELEQRVNQRTQELAAAKRTLELDLVKRQRDEQRLATHYTITRLLAESSTLGHITSATLRQICDSLAWDLGIFWQIDRHAGVARFIDSWSSADERLAEFVNFSRGSTFHAGAGLPGRIWSLSRPVWITDLSANDDPDRADRERRVGLQCALGFPIVIRGDVLGVIELFSFDMRHPDENLVEMMTAVGSQIGLFIERKRAEEELRESEERFRTVAETAAEAIITIDARGTIVFINRAGEHIFGYTIAEMLGQNLTMLMPERFRSAHKAGMARYLATGQRKLTWEVVNLPGLHKSGKEIPLELAFWEFTQQGKIYISSIVRDITDRVQAAELRTRLLEQVIFAQEEERRRIARELHDETGQSLMSLLVGLKAIETSQALEEAQAHARQYRGFAAQALDEVRRLAMGLRPSVLDDMGLTPALERHAAEYMRTYGIAVDFHGQGLESRLPSAVEITLYRIIQEALTNVAKHAEATIVSIVIEHLGSSVRAIVEDNGRGFDVEATLRSLRVTKHFGLLSMRERAALVNGSIMFESTPGSGTTVCVKVPLENAHNGEN
jgi:two-component system sensor kinase